MRNASTTAILGMLLPLASAAMAQKHAPTLAQCRADLAVWNGHDAHKRYYEAETLYMQNGTPNQTEIQQLSVEELNLRSSEMADCEKVDPERLSDYADSISFDSSVRGERMLRFLNRHNLIAQFMQEDAAGKR